MSGPVRAGFSRRYVSMASATVGGIGRRRSLPNFSFTMSTFVVDVLDAQVRDADAAQPHRELQEQNEPRPRVGCRGEQQIDVVAVDRPRYGARHLRWLEVREGVALH